MSWHTNDTLIQITNKICCSHEYKIKIQQYSILLSTYFSAIFTFFLSFFLCFLFFFTIQFSLRHSHVIKKYTLVNSVHILCQDLNMFRSILLVVRNDLNQSCAARKTPNSIPWSLHGSGGGETESVASPFMQIDAVFLFLVCNCRGKEDPMALTPPE